MKRISVLLVILVTLSLIFVSCSQPLPPPASPQPTPIPTPTPEPTPTLPPMIEVKWESSGPAHANAVTIDDNEGRIIYAVSMPTGIYSGYVWKSEDGGDSWEHVGQITDPEINFKKKEQILHDWWPPNAIVSLFATKHDPNNENIILKTVGFGKDPNSEGWEFRLSFDGGESWSALNFPPGLEPEGNIIFTDKHHFDLVSYNGTLKLFLAAGKVWQASLGLPE